MKINNIFKALLVVAASTGLWACTEKEDFTRDMAEAPGAYFPSDAPATYEVQETANSFDVQIKRIGTAGDLTVGITAQSNVLVDSTMVTLVGTVFKVPSSVTFAAGSDVANLTISYDPSLMTIGANYPMYLSMSGDAQVTSFGLRAVQFQVTIPAPYSPVLDGNGEPLMVWYRDGYVAGLFNVPAYTYQLPLEQSTIDPKRYRLVNPYGEAWPLNYDGAFNLSSDNSYLNFVIEDNNHIYVEESPLNIAISADGPLVAWSGVGYDLSRGNQPNPEEYGSMDENGLITFPVKALLQYFEGGTSLYYGNIEGTFAISMTGRPIVDYSAQGVYTGFFTDADGAVQASVMVTMGVDAAGARVGVLRNANSPADAIKAVADGTVESTYINYSEQAQQVMLPVGGSGDYTVGIVTYNQDDKAVGEGYVEFSIVGSSENEDDWTSIGLGDYFDGWVIPFFSIGNEQLNPKDWPWTIEIQRHVDNANVIRLVSPYTSENCELLEYNLNKSKANIVFDLTDPNWVNMEPQYSGFTLEFKEGPTKLYIGSAAPLLLEFGNTKEELIGAGLNNSYKDGVLTIGYPVYGPAANDVQYVSSGDPNAGIFPFPSQVILPEMDTRSAAKAADIRSRLDVTKVHLSERTISRLTKRALNLAGVANKGGERNFVLNPDAIRR